MTIRIRKRHGRWTAFCRWCWWFRSYPTHLVALHAALQHLWHWTAKQQDTA